MASAASSGSQQQLDSRAEVSSRGQFPADHLQELHESKQELILKVQSLKKELQDWRGRMDSQVKAYKLELGGMQQSLHDNLQGLRGDLQDMRARIRSQLASSDEMLGAMDQKGDPGTRRLAATAAQPISGSGVAVPAYEG